MAYNDTIISLFGKVNNSTKLVYRYGDSVVIGSHTLKEYAFQVGNFMNMLYGNIEKESTCMTNKVVVHNLCFELRRFKENCSNEIDNLLYNELISNIHNIPNNENAYILFDRCCKIVSIILSDYYFIP